MPTHEQLPAFLRDLAALSPAQRRRFLSLVRQFGQDLRTGPSALRPSLRLKRLTSHPGIWEMSWAPDGRATFSYSDEVIPGQHT